MELWLLRNLFLFVFITAALALKEFNFLNDYFKQKNLPVTSILCWKFGDSFMSLEKPKALTVLNQIHQRECSFFRGYYQASFLVDTRSCNLSMQFFEKGNECDLFIQPFSYLVLTDGTSIEELKARIANYRLMPSSDVTIAHFDPAFDGVKLYQPYKISEAHEIIWEFIGFWSKAYGISYKVKAIIASRRSNLRKMEIIMANHLQSNNSKYHLTDLRYPGEDTFIKQDLFALGALVDYLNATRKVNFMESYGYYDEKTQTWNGVVRELVTKKAHISGQTMFYTKIRLESVDFVALRNPLHCRFLLRKPSTSFVKNIFVLAFKWQVWVAIFAVLTLYMFTLWTILQFERISKQLIIQSSYKLSDSALIMLEAVCQQGTCVEPKSLAGRTAVFILFLAFLFIYVSYSAYIVVLLQSTTNINSLGELLESRIEAGGQNAVFSKYYFEEPKEGVLRQLYLQKIYPNNYYSLEEGIRKVQEGGFAFNALLGQAYHYVAKTFTNFEVCTLQELPSYTEHLRGYAAITKNSPYKEIFNIGLVKIKEHGIQSRGYDQLYMKPKCFVQTANFKTVGIYDCYEIFIIWIFGFIVALLMLAFENILNKLQDKRRRRERVWMKD